MNGWIHDLRLAFRLLVREPVFTIVAVVTLALGIGLNSAVFSVVNAVLFAPLQVADSARLARVYTQQAGGFLDYGPVSTADYHDLAADNDDFTFLAASSVSILTLELGDANEMIIGELVSGNYFQTLGLRAAVGRLIGPEDDRRGAAESIAVISHATWRKRFDAARDVVGRSIRVNGAPVTIVGVATADFKSLAKGLAPELWLPLELAEPLRVRQTFSAANQAPDPLRERRSRWLMLTGRRASGVSLEQINTALDGFGARLARSHPETNEGRTFVAFAADRVRIMPGIDRVLATASTILMVLVSLVLLIACANVASMLLSRATARRKEVATRLAMGASRWALSRQLLAESLLLSALGAALGLAIAKLSNDLLGNLELPFAFQLDLGLAIDGRVLAFTCAIATLTAVLFGMVPALDSGRSQLVSALRESAGSGTGRGVSRLRKALVISQVAVSMLLLVVAGLAGRSLRNAQLLSPGFDPDGVAVATFSPQLQGYQGEAVQGFFDQLEARVGSLPRVEQVSFASYLPLTFVRNTNAGVPDAQRGTPTDEWPELETAYVDVGYFDVMRIALRRGRAFDPRDTDERPDVTVVNETLARSFWPDQDPIGRRLWVDDDDALTVVGVVADGKYVTLGESPRPIYYRAMRQAGPGRRVLLARTSSSVPSLLPAIRERAREIDPQIAISELTSLRQATSSALVLPRAGATLFGIFGLLGLFLAVVGLYGLIAHSVSQRTHELGIRVAMGANNRDILGLVVREGMTLTAIGAGIGLVAAVASSRVLTAILYGVGPTDLLTFGGVTLFLLAATLAATWIPARRATRLDPQIALRCE